MCGILTLAICQALCTREWLARGSLEARQPHWSDWAFGRSFGRPNSEVAAPHLSELCHITKYAAVMEEW